MKKPEATEMEATEMERLSEMQLAHMPVEGRRLVILLLKENEELLARLREIEPIEAARRLNRLEVSLRGLKHRPRPRPSRTLASVE